ncbi:MAG: transposase [Gammaproteobacteria bacterium]|nr:transposase [Gammaproteobacteria bacterium]
MAYSLDFCKKVFRQKSKKGLAFAQMSEQFGIDIVTLFRWEKQLIPSSTRNKPPTKIDNDKLLENLKNNSEDY